MACFKDANSLARKPANLDPISINSLQPLWTTIWLGFETAITKEDPSRLLRRLASTI
jgi:hypothetical protein